MLFFTFQFANAQNVGIGTNTPDPSAQLEVSSKNRGFLPPRMSTSERDAIINPAKGLQIYNTTTDCLEIFGRGKWNAMYCVPNTPPPTLNNGLVVYYPFNGNAYDESGNGNNGTMNGATLTTDRFGNANKAYYFNGNSDITISTLLTILSNNGSTLSGWFYNTASSSHVSYIVSFGNPDNFGESFGMGEYGSSGIFTTFQKKCIISEPR